MTIRGHVVVPSQSPDEVMVVQVFENLIGNSIKHRGDAAPAIHISAVRAGEWWQFSVRDNGVGIDRADAERVFDIFRRVDGKGVPGTGIGLALCRKGGGTPRGTHVGGIGSGEGAAFRFTIPIYLDKALPGFSTS